LFSVIALSHRDDVPSTAAWRPNNHHHTPGEISDRLKSRLAIVTPAINDIQAATTKHMRRIGEVDCPVIKGLLSLGRVERDPHSIIVPPKMAAH
jgi:hypothetical protein